MGCVQGPGALAPVIPPTATSLPPLGGFSPLPHGTWTPERLEEVCASTGQGMVAAAPSRLVALLRLCGRRTWVSLSSPLIHVPRVDVATPSRSLAHRGLG